MNSNPLHHSDDCAPSDVRAFFVALAGLVGFSLILLAIVWYFIG